jgi:hypothetical protein
LRRSKAKKNLATEASTLEHKAFPLVQDHTNFFNKDWWAMGALWPTRRSPPLSLKHSIKLLLFSLSIRDWIL